MELSELGAETLEALRGMLDPELPAVNPLDAWSRGGPNAGQQMTDALSVMMQDPSAAMGALVHDRAPDGGIYGSYIDYMREARQRSGKAVALVAARQGTGSDERVVPATHEGYPVLDGLPSFLRGVRALFDYREFLTIQTAELMPADAAVVPRWSKTIIDQGTLDEARSLDMLREFHLPAAACESAGNESEVESAASRLGFPMVLKTAQPGIHHKTDKGGVVLGLDRLSALLQAYDHMAAELGPRVLLAPMVESGVEMILGARSDPQFGPIVLLGFGGVLADVTKDVTFAMPPFDRSRARRCIDRLRLRPLLDGVRGSDPSDIDAFCEAASRFSIMVDALRDVIHEIDVNPIIVHEQGCTAVDALVVGNIQA